MDTATNPFSRSKTLILLPALLLLASLLDAPTAAAQSCLNDIAQLPSVNCTANDVRISSITVLNGVVECLEGEDIQINTRANLLATAQQRYDIGMYLALDGGNAINGTCARDFLTPIETTSNPPMPGSGVGPFRNLEPGDANDVCGDIKQGETTIKNVGVLNVVCQDTNNDGLLDIGTCVSWDNNAQDTCTGLNDVAPGTGSKCRCEPITVNIVVLKTAEIEVVKVLSPTSDPGKFNLQIDGENKATDVGDGGTTGAVTVSAGTQTNPGDTHTVGETAGTGNDLDRYDASISCVDRGLATFNGGAPLTATGPGPLNVPVDPDDDIVCTITNERRTLIFGAPGVTLATFITRTWTWTIEKSANKTDLMLALNEEFPVEYDVTVDASSQDVFRVEGTIIITNPTPATATIVAVTDDIEGIDPDPVPACEDDNMAAVVFPHDLDPGESITCTFSQVLPDATQRTNTVVVETSGPVQGITDEQAFDFTSATLTEIDECIDVSDTHPEFGATTQVCAGDAPQTFEYDKKIRFTDPADCGPQTVDNTASFVTSDDDNDTGATGESSWTVNVTVQCEPTCTLTQGYWKTHNSTFHADKKGKGPAPDPAWNLLGDRDQDTYEEAEGELFFKSKLTFFQVLWTAPKGNVYYNLAHQYIAALLNNLNGALFVDPDVQMAFNHATQVLANCKPGDLGGLKGTKPEKCSGLVLNRSGITDLAGILGDFNEGNRGVPHCDEFVPDGVTARVADAEEAAAAAEAGLVTDEGEARAAAEVPTAFSVTSYPNPFNPTTTLRIDLPEAAYVRLTIYDVLGREVIRLVDRDLAAGTFTVTWDASGLPSGTYFYTARAGELTQTGHMVLMK